MINYSSNLEPQDRFCGFFCTFASQNPFNMIKGDCFLCSGETQRTLYYITDVRGNKCDALSIYISPTQIQGLEYDSEYDIDLPDNIIVMPTTMYKTIKQLMRECVDDIHKILKSEALDVECEIEANSRYTDGNYIYTMTLLKEGRWHYNLFRVECENISPDWTGDAKADDFKDYLRPITNDTFEKVQQCFSNLQEKIAYHLEQKS